MRQFCLIEKKQMELPLFPSACSKGTSRQQGKDLESTLKFKSISITSLDEAGGARDDKDRKENR